MPSRVVPSSTRQSEQRGYSRKRVCIIGRSSCHGRERNGHLWKLERAAPAAGGVRRGPGHESLPSNEAESQGGVLSTSPTSRSYKGPLRRAPDPHPAPGPSLVFVVGPRHFWAAPRSLAWAWVSTTDVASHLPGLGISREGAFWPPESLPGQQRVLFAGPTHTAG